MKNRDIYGRRICPYCHGEPGSQYQYDPQSQTYACQFYCKGCGKETKVYTDYNNGADAFRAAEQDFDEGRMT